MSTPPSIIPPPDPQAATLAQMQLEIAALNAKLEQKNAPKASTLITTILTHWKSTANGLLAMFITGGLALLATGSTMLSPRVTLYITIGLAVARAWVGAISKDGDALTATDISKQTAVASAKQA